MAKQSLLCLLFVAISFRKGNRSRLKVQVKFTVYCPFKQTPDSLTILSKILMQFSCEPYTTLLHYPGVFKPERSLSLHIVNDVLPRHTVIGHRQLPFPDVPLLKLPVWSSSSTLSNGLFAWFIGNIGDSLSLSPLQFAPVLISNFCN